MKLAFGAGLFALGFLAPLAAASAAPRDRVIHRFTGSLVEGGYPQTIIAGPGGVLYGAIQGGIFQLKPPSPGHTEWTDTTINTHLGNVGGVLLLGKDGSIYGRSLGVPAHNGAVFRVTPPGAGQTQWTTTILHAFTDVNVYVDDIDLVAGSDGALYGTISLGGTSQKPDGGKVFRLAPSNPSGTEWAYTVLHSFVTFDDYCFQPCGPGVPNNLLPGPGGVLYGTTSFGGPLNNGTVYQLTPPKPGQTDWGFTILHNFGDNDGVNPSAALVADANGVLYGTTTSGSGVRGGTGVVFKITPPTHGEIRWPYNVIHTFTGGYGPHGKLLLGGDGALYGATLAADSLHTCPYDSRCGVVFKLSRPPPGTIRWPETVLHDFTGRNGDTYAPYDITFGRDPDGSMAIFGVSIGNGVDYGSVFEVKLAP